MQTIAVGLAVSWTPFAQATEAAGLLQVNVPPGWTRGSAADTVEYTTPGTAGAPGCRIELRRPRVDQRDVAAALQDEWHSLSTHVPEAARHPLPAPRVQPWRTGWQEAITTLQGERAVLWLVAFGDGARSQVVLASGPRRCPEAFRQFLAGLGPVQPQAPTGSTTASPKEAAVPGSLVGWWRGETRISTVRYPPSFSGSQNIVLESQVTLYDLLLLPDGSFTEKVPPGGLDDASLKQGAERRGRYSVSADGQTLLLHDPAPSTRPRDVKLCKGVPCTPDGPMWRHKPQGR